MFESDTNQYVPLTTSIISTSTGHASELSRCETAVRLNGNSVGELNQKNNYLHTATAYQK